MLFLGEKIHNVKKDNVNFSNEMVKKPRYIWPKNPNFREHTPTHLLFPRMNLYLLQLSCK